MRFTLTVCFAVPVLALAGCYRVDLPGMSYVPPNGWIREDPTSEHRLIQYRLRGESKGAGDARIVLYYFGEQGSGSVEANIDHWAAQFRQDDGRPSLEVARVEHHESNGLAVHTVEVQGTYVATTADGKHLNEPDRSMHAAIVYTVAGPYYFKVVGPTATVRRWDDSYTALLNSLKPAPVPTKPKADDSDSLEEVIP